MTYHILLNGKDISIPHTDRQSAETSLRFFQGYYGKKADLKIEERGV